VCRFLKVQWESWELFRPLKAKMRIVGLNPHSDHHQDARWRLSGANNSNREMEKRKVSDPSHYCNSGGSIVAAQLAHWLALKFGWAHQVEKVRICESTGFTLAHPRRRTNRQGLPTSSRTLRVYTFSSLDPCQPRN